MAARMDGWMLERWGVEATPPVPAEPVVPVVLTVPEVPTVPVVLTVPAVPTVPVVLPATVPELPATEPAVAPRALGLPRVTEPAVPGVAAVVDEPAEPVLLLALMPGDANGPSDGMRGAPVRPEANGGGGGKGGGDMGVLPAVAGTDCTDAVTEEVVTEPEGEAAMPSAVLPAEGVEVVTEAEVVADMAAAKSAASEGVEEPSDGSS
jgi:hypothetical protein